MQCINKQKDKPINNIKLTLTFESLNSLRKVILTIFHQNYRIALLKMLSAEVHF